MKKASSKYSQHSQWNHAMLNTMAHAYYRHLFLQHPRDHVQMCSVFGHTFRALLVMALRHFAFEQYQVLLTKPAHPLGSLVSLDSFGDNKHTSGTRTTNIADASFCPQHVLHTRPESDPYRTVCTCAVSVSHSVDPDNTKECIRMSVCLSV